MANVKISVMVPIYNTSKYLKKCLDSIINQSLKEIEIICVNDGSTDNSLEILKEYQQRDKRIIIINKKNGGLTSARNCALRIAKGEYCLNIDSDDWIEGNYFETIYNKADEKKLDILISDIVFEYSSLKKSEIKRDMNLLNDEIIDGKTYIEKFFTINFLGYTWNKLIKRELYTKYDIEYNENIFMLEDVEVVGKLGYFAKRIGKVNEAFYHYRIGENNGSFNNLSLKHVVDSLKCFKNLEYFYENYKENFLLCLVKRKKNLRIIGMLLSGRYVNSLPEYEEIIEEYLETISQEKFILKKYEDVIRDERYIKILLFNFIKLFKIDKKKIKKLSLLINNLIMLKSRI
ncbi:glycosyltransferase family 2 protein [Fusobacterium mortiferum]|uniref:glycosyltransferase family 2 protein n=1 Tax=Fusobacterium mortiferum TaxID=850 RepID=UPI0011C125A2|nr:glycosyltransferase family 2 protein [Fusobacterium mortiferum]